MDPSQAMTDKQIHERHRRRLLPWHRAAVKLVSGLLADARAHAVKAVTESLKATPDGRASAAVVRRNPSFLAALARLDELWAAIGGPTVNSITGLVQDCAEACYRDAIPFWRRGVPEEFLRKGELPTQAQAAYVRGLLWFGLPIRMAFAPALARARHDLAAAIGAAGSTVGDPTALRTWETQQRTRLIQYLGLALNDADQRADSQAMRDVIDPKYLTKESLHG